MNEVPPKDSANPARFKILFFATFLVVLFAIAAIWRFLPLENWFRPEKLSGFTLLLKSSPFGPLYTVAAYVIGGFLVFPVVILIPATAFVFGPTLGAIYSLLGLLANAIVLYALGHVLGHETVHRLAGKRVNQISHRLARHGLLTIATLRLLPLAPFTVINLVSGASHIKLREYTLGTTLGISPAIFVMTLLGTQLQNTLNNPAPKNLLMLTAITVLLISSIIYFKWRSIKPFFRT